VGVMNTYYLKKFRKEAYQLYGIMCFINLGGEEVWNVGERYELKPSYACFASHYYNKEDALKALNSKRRTYILLSIKELRNDKRKKELRKINKQLAKL
jgi:hypothetical protein